MTQVTLKIVKTRKTHKCWGCTKEYPSNTEMTYFVGVDQGDFSTSYWCAECTELIENLEEWQREDGFTFGELKEYSND